MGGAARCPAKLSKRAGKKGGKSEGKVTSDAQGKKETRMKKNAETQRFFCGESKKTRSRGKETKGDPERTRNQFGRLNFNGEEKQPHGWKGVPILVRAPNQTKRRGWKREVEGEREANTAK